MKNSTTILLVVGILLLVNFLSQRFFFRLDFTEGNQYTLSKASKDILKDLNEPVTVTAYFSKNLPPQLAKAKSDFQDMLYEYGRASKGMVAYEIVTVDPDDQEQQQKAVENGISPQQVQQRKNNELVLQAIFSGAVIQYGEGKEIIPFILPDQPIEYPLSTGIKKLSAVDKPSVGIISGHGEPELQQLQQVYESLSILYNVESVNLDAEEGIAPRFKTLALIGPKDSIPPRHFAKLDEFLGRGGNLFIGIDRVIGDLSTASGSELTTGLESWLRNKGAEIENAFIVDASCGSVSVQQQSGPFRFANQVKFPYFPMITNFPEHPVTKGLETAMLPFASPIRYNGDSSVRFTPIAFTSAKSGTLTPPIYFDVNKDWQEPDFPISGITVGAVLEGAFVNNVPSRIVLFSDGEFPAAPVSGTDNVNLFVNSVDWLSDDTGLIDLRTKGVSSRPIDQIEDSTKNMLKILNLLMPILLVIFYGIFRSYRRNSIRVKRMQENYG